MITDRIKALFNFIEFLHSNIDNFNNYNDLIRELEFIKTVKNKLNPKNNYIDKIKFDDLQAELESKFKILQYNTSNPIKAKAKDLDLCNFDNEPNYSFNGVETEIQQLKDNFIHKDLTEIFKHKNQYIEYRIATHRTFLSLGFFFDQLDEITKSLFDFFKESEQNEFEAFETKTIEVNTIQEAIEVLTSKNAPIKTNKILDFEKDRIFNEMVFNKGLYYFSDTHKSKIQKIYKNLENDFETNEQFVIEVNRLLHSNGLHFYSRLRTITNDADFIKYIESQYNLYNEYTPNNSLKWLNFTKKCIMYGFGILRIDNDNLKALFIHWYNQMITNVKPQQNEKIKSKKLKKILLEFIHNVENKEAFIHDLKTTFPTEQGKSIKAIVLKLVEVKILIYGTKEFSQFYNELKTYFNRDIGTYQSINDVKTLDKETTDTIYKKLNPLITKYKAI